jgi:hypothetical protein
MVGLILFVQFFPNALGQRCFELGEFFNDAKNIGQVLLAFASRLTNSFPVIVFVPYIP